MAEIDREGILELNTLQSKVQIKRGLSSKGNKWKETMFYRVRKIHCLFLPSAKKLWKGNVFTSVCQELCPQRGMSGRTPQGRHPAGQTPPGQTPSPGQKPPSRRLLQRMVRMLLESILVVVNFRSF